MVLSVENKSKEAKFAWFKIEVSDLLLSHMHHILTIECTLN